MKSELRTVIVSAAALTCGMGSANEPPLKLMVVHRPPYLVVDARGGFSGTALVPVVLAMRRAGIAHELVQVPALRQLDEVKAGKNPVCAVGWYKTPEREQYSRFSDPVSKDASWVGVTRAQFPVAPNATVDSILNNASIHVLVKAGYVHGTYLDTKIAAMKSQRVSVTEDMPQLVQMLALGRSDITFMPVEEIQYYLLTGVVNSSEVNVVKFAEMPDGYTRHLMCSKAVNAELIKKFDAALLSAGTRK